MQENMDYNPIKECYRNQEIFITGATGLIGKSLVEKFLRYFPDIKQIYLLFREKKGKTVKQRLEEFKNHGIFNLVRQQQPEALNKIIAIKGDITEINLGLSLDDIKLLENTSFVFHVAATIRFDEPLKKAILQNTRATREALKIAETFKNLKNLYMFQQLILIHMHQKLKKNFFHHVLIMKYLLRLQKNLIHLL